MSEIMSKFQIFFKKMFSLFMLLGKMIFICHPHVWHWENEEEIYCGELLCSILLKDCFACMFSNLSWLKQV